VTGIVRASVVDPLLDEANVVLGNRAESTRDAGHARTRRRVWQIIAERSLPLEGLDKIRGCSLTDHDQIEIRHFRGDEFVAFQSPPERPVRGNAGIGAADRLIENLDYPIESIHQQTP
jgi:hypothetical protein